MRACLFLIATSALGCHPDSDLDTADPSATPDTGCVDRTLPMDFDPGQAYAEHYFGTEQLWD